MFLLHAELKKAIFFISPDCTAARSSHDLFEKAEIHCGVPYVETRYFTQQQKYIHK